MYDFKESSASAVYYNTVSDVLDDIQGKGYLVTEAHVQAIRSKLLADKTSWHNAMIGLVNKAFELGTDKSWWEKEQLIQEIKECNYDVKQ